MSLYRKYRPQKFADVVGEDHVRDTLLLALVENRVSHGYLFAGQRGCGKTSIARLLAKAVNCQKRDELNQAGNGEPCGECQSCKEIAGGKSLDIIEIDAASNRGIDEIRELRDRVKFAPASSKYKVFIIDEVHMLTTPAFNALLKTLEEPPAHAIFIMATTEVQKVPATILSRVQRFDFRRIGKDDIIKNLKLITKSEKLKADDAALEAIAVAADGSHRDSISILEQVASISKKITFETVRDILGLAKDQELISIVEVIAEKASAEKGLKIVADLTSSGVDPAQIISGLIEILRQVLLIKISEGQISFDVTKERSEKLKGLAAEFSDSSTVNRILSKFIECNQLAKDTPIRSLPVEMAIVESCGFETENLKLKVKNDNSKFKIEQSKPSEKKIEEPDSSTPLRANNSEVQQLDGESWKKILETIKESNHTLNALLRDAKPLLVSDNEILLSVKFKFHHDKISEIKNRQAIEAAIKAELGKEYLVHCQIQNIRQASSVKSQAASQETDLEAAAKEIFEIEN